MTRKITSVAVAVNAASASSRSSIRAKGIAEDCFLQQTPYVIFVGIGFDQIGGEADTFQKCITRADDNLYIDKKNCKLNNQTTVLK